MSDLRDQRLRLLGVWEERLPGGWTMEYRGFTVEKEPRDAGIDGCWQIVSPSDDVLTTVELDEFESARDWLRYVDAVVQHGTDHAGTWVSAETSAAV